MPQRCLFVVRMEEIMSFIVAIDGPAGTGKGTVTEILSKKFNLINIDTGATYRCVTLAALQKGYTLEQEEKIVELLNEIQKLCCKIKNCCKTMG